MGFYAWLDETIGQPIRDLFRPIYDLGYEYGKGLCLDGIDKADYVDALEIKFTGFYKRYREDPDVLNAYNQKKESLTAQGYITMADVAAGYIGTQIAKGMWMIESKALPPLMKFIDAIAESYHIEDAQRDEMKSLAQGGEFGLLGVALSFATGMGASFITPYFEPYRADIGYKAWAAHPTLLLPEDKETLLAYREKITMDEYHERMKQFGLSESEADLYYKSVEYFPSPTDFIRFAVREVFVPAVVEKYGYDEEFPVDIVPYAKKAGMPEDTLKWYWRAHWELPSTTQGFEMLHRRVIDETDLRTLLRIADVAPYWIDKIIQISYRPYSRVDVRRMYRIGVLDYDEVKEAYLDLGYDDEHATGLADFAKVYYEERERDTSKSDILKFYREEMITEEEARTRLGDLGFRAEDVDMYIDLENIAKEGKAGIKERALTKADILGMLSDGLIDEADARDRLLDLRYLDTDVDLLLGRVKPDVPGAVKKATVSDIKRAFREGVITESDLRAELMARKYEPTDIEMIVSTEIARLPLAPVKLTASKAQEAFRKGVITEAALRTKLSELDYSAEEIDIAIAMNLSMPTTVTKTLTKAEALKAWGAGIIDIEECVDRLMKQGYDQYDIEILLKMAMPEEEMT